MNEFYEFDEDLSFSEENGEINLIPLLDTIFILLIFFSLLLINVSQTRAMDIELPQGEGVAPAGTPWRVFISRDGDLMRDDGEIMTPEVVKEYLQSRRPACVLLSADGRVAFERVIEVLNLMEDAGLENLSVEVTSP